MGQNYLRKIEFSKSGNEKCGQKLIIFKILNLIYNKNKILKYKYL